MSDAPKRLWASAHEYGCFMNTVFHVGTNIPIPSFQRTQYTRTDLHAELVKAADDLAEAVDGQRNMVCQDFGMQADADQRVDAALSAYKQARVNMEEDT